MADSQISGKQIKIGTISREKLDFNINQIGYENTTPTTSTVGGIQQGSIFPVGGTVEDVLDNLFYPEIAPTINTTPQPVYEMGLLAPIAPINPIIQSTITRGSEDILTINLRRNNAQINTNTNISQIQPFILNFTDTVAQTNTVVYTIEVQTTKSLHLMSDTARFVHPSFFGSGSANLTQASIRLLTKGLFLKSERIIPFSPNLQRFYYAYPSSYGSLQQIIDPSGFNVISDFIIRVVSFTSPSGLIQNYNIYEFNANTTQVNFNLTFRF